MKLEKILADEEETVAIGKAIGRGLGGKGSVFLKGDLGTGKTTLCRGILRAMHHEGAVKSPTFTLVEPYDLAEGQVFHFDLYRLSSPDELEYIGVDDYFANNNLCLVEWPERAIDHLPNADLLIELFVAGRSRRIKVVANSEHGKQVVEQLLY